jgi:hypothetical protein
VLPNVVIILDGNPELLEIVAALSAAARFASGLDSREQERYEDTDDRDHDQ